jgi:hypothetical protein
MARAVRIEKVKESCRRNRLRKGSATGPRRAAAAIEITSAEVRFPIIHMRRAQLGPIHSVTECRTSFRKWRMVR